MAHPADRAVIPAVGADDAVVEPAALLAVTAMRSVELASADASVYVAAVAPAIEAHEPPELSQRCHWYVYVIGVAPLHVPGDDVSVWPTAAVPLIVGNDVTDGGAAGGGGGGGGGGGRGAAVGDDIAGVAAEVAADDPFLLVAVTTARAVAPSIPEGTAYVAFVAPVSAVQFAPPESQRSHW